MPLFRKSADKAKPLTVAPGMYGNESPEQAIFDRTTRITVDRNHWKLATVGLGVIAVAAILTREPPPSVVKVVGVSSDVTGKPITRELDAFRPDERQVQAALKDLVQRWFTVEPILTPQIESSRMAANLRSVREQMLGAAKDQFNAWVQEDEPFRQVMSSPTLKVGESDASRNVDAVGVSPDQLNFEYAISGSASFKPETAFDDGKALWLRLPNAALQNWPVAFIKDGSDFVVVNAIRRGGYLVVQRLADTVVLRSGDDEVKIERGRRRVLGLF